MTARRTFRTRPRTAEPEGLLGRLLVLAPIDVLAETIFSILIMLTFTLAFRIFVIGSDPTQPLAAEYIEVADDPVTPDVIEDAVDEIIETVLAKQGRVVFVANGQLEKHQRIALILRY